MDQSLNLNESADGYCRTVVYLNARWRIVGCKHGLQWILQHCVRKARGAEWNARSYCRTREALIRVSLQHAGQITPSAWLTLDALPGRLS